MIADSVYVATCTHAGTIAIHLVLCKYDMGDYELPCMHHDDACMAIACISIADLNFMFSV